jgi:hypothetical protein
MSHCRCRIGFFRSAVLFAAAASLVLPWGDNRVLGPPAHAKPGLVALTRETNDTIAKGLVVVRLEGAIEAPMAQGLNDIWSRLGPSHERLLIDLDSPGGDLLETEALIEVIADIRRTADVDTLVRHDAKCASACVAVFVQGAKRHAGSSSTWMFHGACRWETNLPSLGQTGRFLDILREAGVATDFLCQLVDEGYVTTPGKLWVSGYELVHVYHANIITDLLKSWRPERPLGPMPYLMIGPH